MAKLKKTQYEETRVQVSISYDLDYKKKDDDNLLDLVGDVKEFKPVEQQRWGCGTIPNGFIIFQGTKLPTREEKDMMINSVNAGLEKCTM